MISKIVLIGASTGGPGQIQKIISALPPLKGSTVIIAQHMMAEFLPSFTKRLQKYTKNHVSIAKNDEVVKSECIYICDADTKIKRNNLDLHFICEPSTSINGYNPSINIIFKSLVPHVKDFKILALILTGIGDDGVDGCYELSLNGVRTITESKNSAIVDGMPFHARERIKNIEVRDMEDIIQSIREFCS